MKYDFCGFSDGKCKHKQEDVELPNTKAAIALGKELVVEWGTVEVSQRVLPQSDSPIAAIFQDGEIIIP